MLLFLPLRAGKTDSHFTRESKRAHNVTILAMKSRTDWLIHFHMILVSSCGDILNDHFCNVFTKEDLDNLPTLEASTLLDMPEITHIQNSVYVTTELELKQSSTIRSCSRSPLPRGNQRTCTSPPVPTGSPSHGGNVMGYVLDINQPSLLTLFTLFLCLFLSLWPFQLYFIP